MVKIISLLFQTDDKFPRILRRFVSFSQRLSLCKKITGFSKINLTSISWSAACVITVGQIVSVARCVAVWMTSARETKEEDRMLSVSCKWGAILRIHVETRWHVVWNCVSCVWNSKEPSIINKRSTFTGRRYRSLMPRKFRMKRVTRIITCSYEWMILYHVITSNSKLTLCTRLASLLREHCTWM